jgi:hypothetical protein
MTSRCHGGLPSLVHRDVCPRIPRLQTDHAGSIPAGRSEPTFATVPVTRSPTGGVPGVGLVPVGSARPERR